MPEQEPIVTEVKFGGNVRPLVETGLKASTVRLVKSGSGPYYVNLLLGEKVTAIFTGEETACEIVPLFVKFGPLHDIDPITMKADGWDTAEQGAADLDNYYREKYGEVTVDTEVEAIVFMSGTAWDALQEGDRGRLRGIKSVEELYASENQGIFQKSIGFWGLTEDERFMFNALYTAAVAEGHSIDDTDILTHILAQGYNRAFTQLGLGERGWTTEEVDSADMRETMDLLHECDVHVFDELLTVEP